MDGALFVVCYYLTVYISGMPPFTPGESCGSCPPDYTTCDGNGLCGMLCIISSVYIRGVHTGCQQFGTRYIFSAANNVHVCDCTRSVRSFTRN